MRTITLSWIYMSLKIVKGVLKNTSNKFLFYNITITIVHQFEPIVLLDLALGMPTDG